MFITINLINNTSPVTRESILKAIENHLWAGGSCYLENKYQKSIKEYESNFKQSAKPIMERAERIARKYYPELFEELENFSVTFIKSEA